MRALRSVLAEHHAEATRTHRRVAADCGYAARLRAQSGARQGLMRGIEACGEATPIVRGGPRQRAR
jgi:hypothetical protein